MLRLRCLPLLLFSMAAALQATTPVPTYGTYFGGTGDKNVPVAVVLDASGNVIVAGYTSSLTLPGTTGAFQPTKANGFPDNLNVFVAKFDPSGTQLQWSTFLGGDDNDMPAAVAVDAAGSIYVVGSTNSTTFPVTQGAYMSGGGGFAAKISADGRSLIYSTYLNNAATGLAVNSVGQAYVVGSGVTCLNSTGTANVFNGSPILGASGFSTLPTSVALDAVGNVYLAGTTGATNIPTTANAFQPSLSATPPSGSNGFVVEVNAAGSQVIYGTYFGPEFSQTVISTITVSGGSLYISGAINASAQWATPGAYLTTPASGFVAKLTPGSATLDAFSYVPRVSPLIAIGNQPEEVYLAFATPPAPGPPVPLGFTVVELSTSTLALVSSLSEPLTGPTGTSFSPEGLALSSPHSLWLVGYCIGSLGNLISNNAYQTTPTGSYAQGVLIELTNPYTTTVTSLTSSVNPSTNGQNVTLTAVVAPSNSTGMVTFQDGATTLGTVTLSGGTATFVTSTLTAGAHSLTAVYGGDANDAPSSSGIVTQTVLNVQNNHLRGACQCDAGSDAVFHYRNGEFRIGGYLRFNNAISLHRVRQHC